MADLRGSTAVDAVEEIAALRTALASEREGHAAARQNFHTMQLAADALRKRAERAEASLAEAKRMLKPFADAAETIAQIDKERVEWKITLDYEALVKAEHIRAAARFLAQEESRPSPKGGPDHG